MLGHSRRWRSLSGSTAAIRHLMRRASGRRTAIYCRLSMDRTGDAASPARQEAACRDIVAAKGWTVTGVFVDRDLSAYKRVPRPAYDEILCALRDRQIDAVAVFKLDRLTRRFTDTGPLVRALEDADAVLLSVHDHIDTSTPMGQAIMGVLVAQAETESLNTSIRVRAAAEESAKRGEPHAGGSRTYGYTPKMEIIAHEAAIIVETAQRVLAGASLRQIAFDLNARGIASTRGKQWHSGAVGRLVRCPIRAGLRVHRGVEVPGTWPPILTPELRLRILDGMATRTAGHGRTKGPKHLLVGFLWCGRCGGRLKSMGFFIQNGQKYPRYQCVKTPGYTRCGGVSISQARLDTYVSDEFLTVAARPKHRPLPNKHVARQLRTMIEQDQHARIELTKARFVDRTIGPDEYTTTHAQLQDRLHANQATLSAWTRAQTDHSRQVPLGHKKDLEMWWETAPLEDRRAALAHLINAIRVHPAQRRGRLFDETRVTIEWR